MPPPAAWTQATLGQMLADHPDKLSQEENGLHYSVKKGWVGIVNHVEGKKGFKHPDKKRLRFISQAFLTKEEAQVDALAKYATHSEKKNQISTLPKRWQTLVKARLANIKAGRKMESVTGAYTGSGEGYRVVNDGKEIELTFTPPPDFTVDRRKGLKPGDHLKNKPENCRKIAAAHAANPTVKRRADLGKKKGKTNPKKLLESTNSPPKKKLKAPPPQPPNLDEEETSHDRGRRVARTTGGDDRPSRSRTRPRPAAPSAAAGPARRRASAAAQPRDDGAPPPRGPGPDDCGEGAVVVPPPAQPAASVSHGGCVDYPSHVVSCEFSPTPQDLTLYMGDYLTARAERRLRPTNETRPTYERAAVLLAQRWEAIGRAGEQPLIRTPCFQVNTCGLFWRSERAIRAAFCEAWKESDGGRRSSLTEAMNVQVFEKTDIGRKLTVAWSGHDLSDRDWLDVRRSFRVNFLMGVAIPETCVFWYRAASGSELH